MKYSQYFYSFRLFTLIRKACNYPNEQKMDNEASHFSSRHRMSSRGAKIFGHGGLNPSKPSKYEKSSVFGNNCRWFAGGSCTK
jgi:hypothetical protein